MCREAWVEYTPRVYGRAHGAGSVCAASRGRCTAGAGLAAATLGLYCPGMLPCSGDGGIYSTAADITAFWRSLFTGRIVPAGWVAEMVRPRSDVPAESMRYGLGFWLGRHDSTVILEGLDAGVSFRSVHDPRSAVTHTVISNSSGGTWPSLSTARSCG